jgi:lactoylglutathione lyase
MVKMQINDHTAFQVSNLEKSIEFYTIILGLNFKFKKINEEEQEAYAFLELNGGGLELIQKLESDYEKPTIKPPYCPHLALETKDMNHTLDLIKKNHLNVIKGPLESNDGEKWIYISDPDNNIIEFIDWGSGIK